MAKTMSAGDVVRDAVLYPATEEAEAACKRIMGGDLADEPAAIDALLEAAAKVKAARAAVRALES